MIVTLDIEGDNLRPDAKRVWCACAIENESKGKYDTIHRFYDGEPVTEKQLIIYRDYPLNSLPTFLSHCDEICMHNGIDYDRWLINRVMNFLIPLEKITDTLVLSKLLDPQRKGNSVEAWAERLGGKKVEHEDWSKFTPEMLWRCEMDVILQRDILRELIKEAADV